MRSSERAAGVESPDASNAWRGRRADVGNAGAAKLMKIAAAVESAAGKPRRTGRGAGVEIRRSANSASAKAAGRRAAIDGVLRLGMGNDDSAVMMAPDRRADDRGAAAKGVIPLIAARIIAGAVSAVVVPAIPAILNCLHKRQTPEWG
jgi:hypothetical protein